MNDFAILGGSTADQIARRGLREDLVRALKPLSGMAMLGHDIHNAIFELHGTTIISAAQAYGALNNCFEDKLNTGRRTTDYTEDLARRGPLFQRLMQFFRPRLLCLEQPRVLDGDDGLVGEGLE